MQHEVPCSAAEGAGGSTHGEEQRLDTEGAAVTGLMSTSGLHKASFFLLSDNCARRQHRDPDTHFIGASAPHISQTDLHCIEALILAHTQVLCLHPGQDS